jgi:hypothetical protein
MLLPRVHERAAITRRGDDGYRVLLKKPGSTGRCQ